MANFGHRNRRKTMSQNKRIWMVGICKAGEDGRALHIDTVIGFGADKVEAARSAADYVLDVWADNLNGYTFRCAMMRDADALHKAFRYLQCGNLFGMPEELFGRWEEVQL